MRTALLFLAFFLPFAPAHSAPGKRAGKAKAGSGEPRAQGNCPKSKKEWQAKGPKLFLKKAALQQSPLIALEDQSDKLGKAIQARAFHYQVKEHDYAMVQAEDRDSGLFLSGVLMCDPKSGEPVLKSLSFVHGTKSGMIRVTRQ